MSATLKIRVIGAIVMTASGLSPLTASAHAIHRPAGRTAVVTANPARPRAPRALAVASAASTCQAAQLAIAPDFSSAATGHIGIELRLHNVSTQPCTLRGYATIVLLDGVRRPLQTVLRWELGGFFNFNRPVRLVSVAPGGNAYMAMGWTHIPTPGQT